MSLWHKLWFSNLYIFSTQYRRSQTFQTMNSSRSKNLSLKYQRFLPSSLKDIEMGKSEFVAKTQFLSVKQCISFYKNKFKIKGICEKLLLKASKYLLFEKSLMLHSIITNLFW